MSERNQLIKVINGERFTPYTLARKLSAAAILESATFEGGRARYSLILVEEAFRVSQESDGIWFSDGKSRRRIRSRAEDILDVLTYFANQHGRTQQDFPFPAGGIGFLTYEFAARCDTMRFRQRDSETGIPEGVFLFGHVLVVYDHYSDLLYLIGLNYREHSVDLEAELSRVEATIHDLNFNYLREEDSDFSAEVVHRSDDSSAFEEGVRALRDEIVNGNLLQAVLSRRIVVRTAMPAIEAYRRLRSNNPAPYLVYLDFGEYRLFAASPEMHVRVKDGKATMRPIAGTRPRGVTEDADQALERELLADEKEAAEHLMLVDLARNDLGRVCAPGSVEVTQFRSVERYSKVMHIVSRVEGKLAEGKTGVDALRATFPAGTVSGAPKIRAIETIDRIEPTARGFYAGVVVYVEPGGALDSCITIRAGFEANGEIILQAGAGVVYDSDPSKEFLETEHKLAALRSALGLREGHRDSLDR